MRVSIAFGILALAAAATASAAATDPQSGFLELLHRDLDRGRITPIQAALHTLAAVREPDALPPAYHVAAANARRLCATPALVFLRRHEEELSREERAAWLRREVRPPSAGFLQSAILPARVHWQDSTMIAQAETCLAILEHSWQLQVGGMGFTDPCDDLGAGGSGDFDLYLDGAMAPGNGFSEGEAEDLGTWWYDRASFVVIGAATEEPLLRVLIAHEFNHSCQWAMDAAEDDAFYENTSSFVEDLTYDEVNDVYNVLPWFQDYPHRSLDYFGEVYQYGAFLWEAFLAEAYGDGGAALVRDLWNASRQASHQNEPDYFDVVDDVLQPSGDGLDEMYVRFSQWRFFTGDWHDAHHFGEAYPEGVRIDQTFANGLIPPGILTPSQPPMEYGATYHLFLPGSSPTPGDLKITLSGSAQKQWAISLLGVRADGSAPEALHVFSNGGAAEAILPNREDYAAVVLVTANLGDGQHDPDQDEWAGTMYSFTASLLPPGSSAPDPGPVETLRLFVDGANPARGGVWLRAEGAGEPRRIAIVSAAGRRTRTFAWPCGSRRARWDGRDEAGVAACAGVYFAADPEGSALPARIVLLP